MREQREYIIDILQRGYLGNINPLYPTGDVLVITQGQMNANEFDPIKGSEAALSLLCVDDDDSYMALFTTDAREFKLRVRRIVSDLGKERMVPEWEGFLSAGTYSQDYKNAPYHVSLNAVDGLALLKDILYLNAEGGKYNGIRTLDDMLCDILGRISDMELVYNRGDIICEPEQESSALASLAIDSQALYSALAKGNAIAPSCYDVLTAVLSTLQLQIFQGYGKWRVRSIASLSSPMGTRGEDADVNNGGESIPIYSDSDDGTGVSVAATLSLCAPYSKINVSRPALEAEASEVVYAQALQPMSWVSCYGNTKASTISWKDRLRIYVSIPQKDKTKDIGVAYIPNMVIAKSPTTSLSMSFDVYNLTQRTKSVRVGLLAYSSSDNIKDKVFRNSSTYLVVDVPIWYWNVDEHRWVKVSPDVYTWGDGIGGFPGYPFDHMWTSIELEGAKKPIRWQTPTPESFAVKTELNAVADNLDLDATTDIRIAMLIVGVADDYDEQGRIPMIELRNPSISLTSTAAVVQDISFDSGSISSFGLGDITYTQHFGDSWVMPTPGLAYQAPLLKNSGGVLRGLVLPMQRPLLADGALSTMRALRGAVARQLDGEVFVKTSLDLNARWIDREGRQYYTNYIRRYLRRGVSAVQLREIPRKIDDIYINTGDLSSPIGLDTSAYLLKDGGLDIIRVDLLSGQYSLVQEISHDRGLLTMNEGQRCISVISDDVYDDGTTGYSLRAYDTNGELISLIDDVSELWYDLLTNSDNAGAFARSARYDANVQMWMLVGTQNPGRATESTLVLMINNLGEVVASGKFTVSSRLGYSGSILMPNGFIFRSVATEVTNWWHSNSKHQDAVVEAITTHMERVLAVNERFIAFVADNNIQVCGRTDLELGFDQTPLVKYGMNNFEWVAMNNALVVVREKWAEGLRDIYVYDARSGRSLSINADVNTQVWLAGDTVYTMAPIGQSCRITAHQILLGDGVGYAPYITSDQCIYITADNKSYLTLK